MQVDYKPFIDRMIGKYEGPYGWNKRDPGGPTKYGITCYDLAEHRGQKMTSMETWAPLVKAMALSEAEDIYATKYAKAVMFDLLPAGADVVIMDYAVNSGIGRVRKVVPTLLGAATYETAVAKMTDIDMTDLVDRICAERLRFMHAIRGGSAWVEFGRGWQARVDDLRAYGEHLVAGGTHETAPLSSTLAISTPKAQHVAKTAETKTAGAIVGGAIAAHAAGISPWGVAGVVGLIFTAGLFYEVYEERRASAANALVHV